MDLPALRVVKAVADTRSVSRAAESLNCVQSNVTARLKRLEEELGVPLFLRLARGMEPTPPGRVLADYADRVLRLVSQARQAVADAAGRGVQLAIGTMETAAAVRLPPVLARFHAVRPDVEMTVQPGTTEELLALVLAGRLDGAFVSGPVDHPELLVEPAFEEELVLVEAAAAPPAGGGGWTLLAFRPGCVYRARAESALRAAGRVPFRVMEFGALDAILGCVAAGMGITVLPRAVVERDPWAALVAARDLPDGRSRVATLFVRRRDAVETGAMRAFRGVAGMAEAAGSATPAPTPRAGLMVPDAAC